MVNITNQKAIHYRLDRWGRAFRIFMPESVEDGDLRAEVRLGSSYGNCILADWVRYGGPPPRGRECCGATDLAENPIEIQTERAVMLISRTRPEIAWALRARWCGHGRVGVERFEIFEALAGQHSKRSFFEYTKQGEAMAFNLLFPNATRMSVAA